MSSSLKRILIFCFFSIQCVFSQNKSTHFQLFCDELKEETDHFDEKLNFLDILTFFSNKEWDSTLVYSSQLINEIDNDTEARNYCHFIKGYSFNRKRLFHQAKNEFDQIRSPFYFQNKVTLYLAEIDLENGHYNAAIEKYKILELKIDSLGDSTKKSNIIHNLALAHLHLKNYDKAEKYLKKNLRFYEKDINGLVGSYGDLANAYYVQYKDELAIPYFRKAYDLSKSSKDFKIKSVATKNMAVVEENRNDLKLALKYRKEYEQWKDSLNDQNKILETAQEIARIEREFAVTKKQNELNVLEALHKANKAERNGFLYTAIALLLLLSTITYFYRKNILASKIIVNQNKRLDALNATKNQLFSIVSHDLRSSVNTLKLRNKTLISNLEKDNIQVVQQLLQENTAIVGSAYNLLDNLLNWALLQTEQAYFEIKDMSLFFTVEHVVYNYIPLMKEKNIHFESAISKTTKVKADKESLKIVLRNLLDNAIKFSEVNDSIKIYTSVSRDGFIDLIIEDSGIGMDEKTLLNLNTEMIIVRENKNTEIVGSGLGLQLCKAMLQKNNGILSIESTLGKGTKMIVSLPISLPDNE